MANEFSFTVKVSSFLGDKVFVCASDEIMWFLVLENA